jgi:hypothetical protein
VKWQSGGGVVEKWEPLMHTGDDGDGSLRGGLGTRARGLDRDTWHLTGETLSRRSPTNSTTRTLKKPKSIIYVKPGDLGWNKNPIKGSGYGYENPNTVSLNESQPTPQDTIRTDCIYYNSYLKLYCRATYTPQGCLYFLTPKTKPNIHNLPDETWETVFKCSDPTNLNLSGPKNKTHPKTSEYKFSQIEMLKNWDQNPIKQARVNNRGVLILSPEEDDHNTHFRPDTLNPQAMSHLLKGRVDSSGYGVIDPYPLKKKDIDMWEEPVWAKPEVIGLEREFTHDELEHYREVALKNVLGATG